MVGVACSGCFLPRWVGLCVWLGRLSNVGPYRGWTGSGIGAWYRPLSWSTFVVMCSIARGNVTSLAGGGGCYQKRAELTGGAGSAPPNSVSGQAPIPCAVHASCSEPLHFSRRMNDPKPSHIVPRYIRVFLLLFFLFKNLGVSSRLLLKLPALRQNVTSLQAHTGGYITLCPRYRRFRPLSAKD
jgi:hypothetical protein